MINDISKVLNCGKAMFFGYVVVIVLIKDWLYCFFDKGKLIVVVNGFQKKSQKTPKKEIERALKLQKQYYDEQEK